MRKISCLIGVLSLASGCYTDGAHDFRSGDNRACQSAPPYVLNGKVIDTDYSHDAIDGSDFFFTINTTQYGNKRIETNVWMKDRIITGDSIKVLLNRCVDINKRVFGVSEKSIVLRQ